MAPAEHIWLCQESQETSEEEEPHLRTPWGCMKCLNAPNVCGELASKQAYCQRPREQPGRMLLGRISARLLGAHFARLGAKRPQELDQGKVCSRDCCHMCFRTLKRQRKPSARSVWCRQVLVCQAYGLSIPMASFEVPAYSSAVGKPRGSGCSRSPRFLCWLQSTEAGISGPISWPLPEEQKHGPAHAVQIKQLRAFSFFDQRCACERRWSSRRFPPCPCARFRKA